MSALLPQIKRNPGLRHVTIGPSSINSRLRAMLKAGLV